jgi:aspartyl/asparaginyl-tRNA synthetase
MGITFVDIRDGSGIAQLIVNTCAATEIVGTEDQFGGHWVQVTGEVVERQTKDAEMKTGEIRVRVSESKVIKVSSTSIKRLIWTYANFGLWMTIKCIGLDIISILAYVGLFLTLPFKFIWLLFKNLFGKK